MSADNPWRPSKRWHVPAELMKPIEDSSAWLPEDLEGTDAWIYRLSDREIEDVRNAIAHATGRDLQLRDISRETFPLPHLGDALAEIWHELMDGRGFAMLRGLPVEDFSLEETAVAFWGIGCYLGRVTPQNNFGHLLGHVKDLGGDYAKVRGYMTRSEMKFHCDSADILSLCCLHPAKAGGAHRICSSVSLYNEMLKSRPDLVKELTKRIYRVRMGDLPPGETTPWVREPVFSVQDGYFAGRGLGAFVLKAQELPGVPKISESLKEAIGVFMETAEKVALNIEFERGDISFVMNHVTLHSRTEFEDWPEPERRRHLLRLWLSTNGYRPLHPDIARALNGVSLGNTPLVTPLNADE